MKSIVKYFISTFGVQTVNWPQQVKIVKSLMERYSREEIVYAIDYYKSKGTDMYSLGFLNRNMEEAVTAKKTEEYLSTQTGDANERNKRKLRTDNQALDREEYYLDLFAEPDEDN